MEMNEILNYVSNNGLAIVLCLYMVIHNTKIVSQNTEAIKSLENVISHLIPNFKVGD